MNDGLPNKSIGFKTPGQQGRGFDKRPQRLIEKLKYVGVFISMRLISKINDRKRKWKRDKQTCYLVF